MLSLNRRKHAGYIQLSAVASIVSFAIVSTSLGTQQWIGAIANPMSAESLTSKINYGLFGGTLIRRLAFSPYQYDLYLTCIWSENACAWSCASTSDTREAEVQQLVDGKTPKFSCESVRRFTRFANFETPVTEATINERVFTNAGLWLSTLIFLVILMIAIIGSFVLSIVNCMKSPIETYLNVQGIYLTNGVALVANILVLVLYAICYDIYIGEDIAIYDTLVGDYESHAWLGYSYWILHVPFVLHIVGICLIIMRERVVNSDRAETMIDIATETPATGVLF